MTDLQKQQSELMASVTESITEDLPHKVNVFAKAVKFLSHLF